MALSIICFVLVQMTMAQANDTYRVVNVAPDDQLNIRVSPSPTAEKVGTLAFDAASISATDNRRQVGSATWVEIKFEQTSGWVNASFLSATQPTSSLFKEPLTCSGTEPFWALQVNDTRGDFDALAEGKSTIEFTSSRSAHGVPIIWALKGKTTDNQSPVFAVLEETNQCSDGMSDLAYRYSIRVDIEDGPFYAGCCNSLPGQPAP